MLARKAHLRGMADLQRLFGTASRRSWTKPDAYVGAMARKRRSRQRQAPHGRTQPERPRLMLSTLPFLTLLGFLAVLAVAIMVLAFPGNHPPLRPHASVQPERGVAAPGWFQDAQREFHG
jgi:hypothetical protein